MNNIEVPVVGAGRRKGISFSLFRGPTLPPLSLSLSSEEEGAIGVKLVRETLCNLYLREKVIDLSFNYLYLDISTRSSSLKYRS